MKAIVAIVAIALLEGYAIYSGSKLTCTGSLGVVSGSDRSMKGYFSVN
ncbi:unnamed protein product [marine sediment metagenome]|uniref:Uncharacterized protein n=1 Tax=marine sediment metagenome TaxID=412755 RepID=X1KKD5_9ZZZZ